MMIFVDVIVYFNDMFLLVVIPADDDIGDSMVEFLIEFSNLLFEDKKLLLLMFAFI